MRLVERVVGERDEHAPQRGDRRLVEALGLHPLGEGDVLGVEHLLLLLAHRATQQVGVAERVARELLGDLHDLLLVDHQAVGRAEDRAERLDHLGLELALELRVERDRLLLAVLAQREVGVRVDAHRARAVEREGRRDVLEVVGLHQLEQRAHAAAVELEDAEGVAAREQVVGGLVGHVLGQRVEVDVLAAVALHVGDGVVEDREVAQAEEVHLDQAERLAARVVELGDDLAVLQAAHDRDDVDERLAAHDDAGRVHAPLALQALEALGGLDDLLQVRLGGHQVAELLALAVARVGGVVDARQRHALAHDVRAASPWSAARPPRTGGP